MPISIVQAALGTEIQVLGLNGDESVKIPEGTQTGEIIRLKGKGLPDPHGGGKGDLYVNIHIETPTKLTREQRRLLRATGSDASGGEPSRRSAILLYSTR